MDELSQVTLQVIQHLFALDQHGHVEHILRAECGRSLIPDEGRAWDALRERVQLGVLKVSGGDFEELLSAILLARMDWRDLLMEAGFGHSITEHQSWARRLLEP